MRRAAIVGALVAGMLAAAGIPASAAPVGPPYTSIAVTSAERPDITGHGTADADASADPLAGTMSVYADATEDLVAGTILPGLGVPVGHSSAESSARMVHRVEIPEAAGPRTITVRATIDGINARAVAQRSVVHTGVTNAQSSVNASLEVVVERCPDVFCHPEARAQDAAPVALSAVPETASSVVLEVTVSTSSTSVLVLTIDAGLFALAGAWGNGVANASATGTVSLIDVTVA